MTAILGISAFYHDSAATIIVDGKIIAAAQEDRFSRIKNDSSYPKNAIEYCLSEAKLTFEKLDFIAFYDKPFLKFERLLETYIAYAPKGFKSFRKAIPIWLKEKLFLKEFMLKEIRKNFQDFDPNKLMFSEHHFSHAASAFYASPFEEAVILTIDGVGEWATTSVAIGKGNKIDIIKEIHFPHSLGLLYSAFTYYLGFKVNSGEYKLMGLAPYGIPVYKELIMEKLIDLKEDGSFRLDQSYFNFATGLTMTNQKFDDLFGASVRTSDKDELTQFHMDIACSIQKVLEEIVLRITRSLSQEYDIRNLCMAGGVALNCVANGKILKDDYFENIWIQPASGDAGGALGSALAVWHKELDMPRNFINTDSMQGSFLGPSFRQNYIEEELLNLGAIFEVFTENQILQKSANALKEGMVMGWFQNRMEFGPRALGNRSILGDPRSEQMQRIINLKIKFRESFRPFAPSILRDDLSEWFNLDCDSPYMLLVGEVNNNKKIEITKDQKSLTGIDKLKIKRSSIPAVTHVDYSARIQTVHKETNSKYFKLLKTFKEKTGCPILINTSFNVRGEPIVCSPKDAFDCFMGTDLDLLVIGNCILRKQDQKISKENNYKNQFADD